ncbi:MAG TPA: sodium:proton antiporter NhaD [Bacteroidales bacterium]|nr:sodium:proton antiporter NhaD [Bacteroidales bacterium]
MFILMIIIFILGYAAIAFEHPLKVDKAVSALAIGTLCWVAYMFGLFDILTQGFSPQFSEYIGNKEMLKNGDDINSFLNGLRSLDGAERAEWLKEMREWIVDNQIITHLGEISEILFFLLGAMAIVEVIDQHEGFRVITDKINTTSKVKLLWIISILTFFLSAVLDNLTTTIVMVTLIGKLISEKRTKWLFASMVVLAANAGGAWSPIGDVTTIMLWIGGQVTSGAIISRVFLPSIAAIIVPLAILGFFMKGAVKRPASEEHEKQLTTKSEQKFILALGVGGLLFVPVFKTITHLPPYMGMLLSLSVIWLVTEIMHRNKDHEIKAKLKLINILKRVELPTVLFFLGILSAVAALQSAGQLNIMANYLTDNLNNVYLINIAIGLASAIVDNVPLVAGAMGMYPVEAAGTIGFAANFVQDGIFWEFLAYTAGTGGSVLIIGSAAGVAAMGIEKIDFIWYLKHISLLALSGYFAGAGVYYVQTLLLT